MKVSCRFKVSFTEKREFHTISPLFEIVRHRTFKELIYHDFNHE